MKNTATNTYSNFTELRKIQGSESVSVKVLGRTNYNDGYGGIFYWDTTSTAQDDNTNIIQKIGLATGRWIRVISPSSDLPSSNSVGGTYTTTGNGLLKEFTFSHNLQQTPDSVIATPNNSNTPTVTEVTYNQTTITIKTSIAPSQGDSISYNWIAIKL